MAINTKTELKALVTANKLTSDLLNNIIDSTSGFDSNGDYVVTVGGNELLRMDSNGNVAWNGSSIPSVLSSLHNFEFFSNNSCAFRLKTNGDTIYGANCYFDGTDFVSIAAGESSRVEEQEIQDLRFKTTAAAGGSGSTATAAGQILTMVLVYQQDYVTGDVKILTGGTFTSVL